MKFPSAIPAMPLITPSPRPRRDRKSKSGLLDLLTLSGLRRNERRYGRERRATPRVKVEVEVEECEGDSRYFGITEDLSTFGLSTRQGLRAVGSPLSLALYLPDGEPTPVFVEARVVAKL